jgi:hypothetical protein
MKNLKITGMRVICLCLSLLILISCDSRLENKEKQGTSSYSESDTRKIKIITGLQRLLELPFNPNGSNFSDNREKITKIIDEFDNPDDISTFALMCRSLAYHCSDMECFKFSNLRPTYDNAYWSIVEKLAKDKEKNKEVLERIKRESFLDAGSLYNWEHIVDGKPL